MLFGVTRSQDQCMLFVNFQQPHQTSDMQHANLSLEKIEKFLNALQKTSTASLPVFLTYLVSA
jgi:hypothetical protein